jgi:16S rRNA A1518/A1519 N6-dimethyltransferase RsmA/KsgA/DIM1 with predicted DNA glycosylase/AP lyase activity
MRLNRLWQKMKKPWHVWLHVFTQRRKTLRNSLKGMLVEDGFEQAGVDPMARPETLTLAQFVALSDQMVAKEDVETL